MVLFAPVHGWWMVLFAPLFYLVRPEERPATVLDGGCVCMCVCVYVCMCVCARAWREKGLGGGGGGGHVSDRDEEVGEFDFCFVAAMWYHF